MLKIPLKDKFGRPTLNFRVSLTQRCNLRCPYCHREGEPEGIANEMKAEEIIRLVDIAVKLGMRHVKLTGGEPLLREDVLHIVEGIANLPGLRDLSMTTNGTLLAKYAEGLRLAGLRRVNVNLLTLDSKKYYELMGGVLDYVLNGIKEAVRVGLRPVKLNTLVLRGVNENEIEDMINFASQIGAILQLIELEPVNISRSYYENYHYGLDIVENELNRKALFVEVRHYMHNRRVYYLPNAKVEVVSPMENTEFCMHCTRLRLTSDGKLKPCLMRNDNLIDVLSVMRNSASDEELIKIFIEAIEKREPYFKVKGIV